jgi:diphthamide biosynthesis methyltransferase
MIEDGNTDPLNRSLHRMSKTPRPDELAVMQQDLGALARSIVFNRIHSLHDLDDEEILRAVILSGEGSTLEFKVAP